MSTLKHTKEPISVEGPHSVKDSDSCSFILAGEESGICIAHVIFNEPGGDDLEACRADAHRLAECWNTLAGIADPAEALRKAREALRNLVEHIGECDERDLLACDSDPHAPSVFSVYAEDAKKALRLLTPEK